MVFDGLESLADQRIVEADPVLVRAAVERRAEVAAEPSVVAMEAQLADQVARTTRLAADMRQLGLLPKVA